ncbi:MAG: hypothetical protein EOP06_07640, partial [Proteobacteria bacterium]
FETKYFELLKLHRDNVAELDLGNATGRKIFVLLIREFRSILSIVKDVAGELRLTLDAKTFFEVSYNVLFYGVGPNSSRVLRASLSHFDIKFTDALLLQLENPNVKADVKAQRGFDFTPFEGHQSRLGHYYRHLFQSVTYVDDVEINIDKYEYVKTIRAQLSTHEQALLFINSLSLHGRPWQTSKLLVRYRLVKNIPPLFFSPESELDISTDFPADYFEWQQ